MTSKHSWRAVALAVVLSMGGGWAQATVGSASVSDLRFELVDLDDADGVTPTLVWGTGLSFASASAFAGTFYDQQDGLITAVRFGNGGQRDASEAAPLLDTAASLGGASAGVSATGVSAQFNTAPEGSSADASASTSGEFTLSANTELRITGLTTVSVSGPSATGFRLPVGFSLGAPLRFADATVFLAVGVFPLTGGSINSLASNSDDFLSANNFTDANSGPTVDAFNLANANRSFSFSLINDTAASLQGQFFAQAGASGSQIAPPSPVPEGSTAWLMAAGLAGMLIQRRRAPGR